MNESNQIKSNQIKSNQSINQINLSRPLNPHCIHHGYAIHTELRTNLDHGFSLSTTIAAVSNVKVACPTMQTTVAQVTGKQIFALWLCAIDLFDQKKNVFAINSGDTSFYPRSHHGDRQAGSAKSHNDGRRRTMNE
jgi:hypothetical protein